MKLRIPNELLNMKLKPNELKVFVYLMRCQSEKGVAIVRAKRIAEICHINQKTVYKASRISTAKWKDVAQLWLQIPASERYLRKCIKSYHIFL